MPSAVRQPQLALGLALCLVQLASCGSPVSVEVVISGPGAARVLVSGLERCDHSCALTLPAGSTLHVEPLPGSIIESVSGVCSAADCRVEASGTVEIVTGLVTRTLDISIIGEGSVSLGTGQTCDRASCSILLTPSANQIIANAIAAPGYRFARWLEPATCLTSECVVPVTGPTALQVEFQALDLVAVELTVVGAGSLTVSGANGADATTCTSRCTAHFPRGETLTLRALAQPGSSLRSATGPCTVEQLESAVCEFTAGGDASASAEFRPLWQQRFALSSAFTVLDFAVFNNGDQALIGDYSSAAPTELALPPCTANCKFLLRVAPSGQTLWAHTWNATTATSATTPLVVEVTGGDSLVVMGLFHGSVAGTSVTGTNPWGDGFVQTFDGSGNVLWTKAIAAQGTGPFYALSAATAGDGVALGIAHKGVTIDGLPIPPATPDATSSSIVAILHDGGVAWASPAWASSVSSLPLATGPGSAITGCVSPFPPSVDAGSASGGLLEFDAAGRSIARGTWTFTDNGISGEFDCTATSLDGPVRVAAGVIKPSALPLVANGVDVTRGAAGAFLAAYSDSSLAWSKSASTVAIGKPAVVAFPGNDSFVWTFPTINQPLLGDDFSLPATVSRTGVGLVTGRLSTGRTLRAQLLQGMTPSSQVSIVRMRRAGDRALLLLRLSGSADFGSGPVATDGGPYSFT